MTYNYIFCWLYFMTKNVVIALILFLVFLWDFIVLGLVLSWWKIEHELKNQCSFATSSQEVREKSNPQKGHVRSICWKLKSQMPATFCECFARQAILRGTHKTFCLEDFKCDFLTLHPCYIYPHYPQKYERLFREKNLR